MADARGYPSSPWWLPECHEGATKLDGTSALVFDNHVQVKAGLSLSGKLTLESRKLRLFRSNANGLWISRDGSPEGNRAVAENDVARLFPQFEPESNVPGKCRECVQAARETSAQVVVIERERSGEDERLRIVGEHPNAHCRSDGNLAVEESFNLGWFALHGARLAVFLRFREEAV